MKVTPFPTRTITINRSPRTTGKPPLPQLKCHKVRPSVAAQKRPNPCPTRALSLSSPPKIGNARDHGVSYPLLYSQMRTMASLSWRRKRSISSASWAQSRPSTRSCPFPRARPFGCSLRIISNSRVIPSSFFLACY